MPSGVPNVTVTVDAPAKPWWRSRMLWLNAVALALVAAESHFALLQPLLPVNLYAVLAFGLPVANAVLRVLTSSALTLGTGREP